VASTRLTSKHYILGSACILAIIVIATSIGSMFFLREQEIETWSRELSDLSLTLSEQTYQSMSSAQLAMKGIVDRINTVGIRSDAELRLKAKSEAFHQILLDKISGLPQVDVATIVAANGDVINFTRSYPPPAINLSDRDYFQAHINNSEVGAFISIPVRNKGNGKWVFYLSYRLNEPNGKLMGLVLIGISVDKLTEFYERLVTNLGEGASITLLRNDFTALSRWPRNDQEIGKKVLTGSSYQVVDRMKKNDAVIQHASPRLSENGLPVRRMSAVRVLDHFPLIVNLTITEEFFLKNWRNASSIIAVIACGSLLILFFATYFLMRITLQREKSNALLNDLTVQIPGMLFQLQQSPDGKITLPYVNKGFLDEYKSGTKQLSVEGLALFDYVHPEDRERVFASIQNSIKKLEPWHEDYRLSFPGKGIEWRHGDATPQILNDQSILLHGYITDITEYKNQQKLIELERDKAEIANRVKSDFLANMSHEIRTPMNAVIGLSGIALQSSDQKEQVQYLHQIQESSQLLMGILNDILDFSKIEAGQIIIEKRVFDIDQLNDGLHRLFKKNAQDKGLDFLLSRQAEIPNLLVGDELRLRQILTNLLGNAVKFTEQGRITLEIVETQSNESEVTLDFRIQDTGIGLSEGQIDKLFKPFVQADNSTARRFGGTGLGLSISLNLARMMGGNITVESVLGKGTLFCFRVTLERATVLQKAEYHNRREADKAPPEYREAAVILRGKRVLLVEDNRVNQLVATQLLKKLSMVVDVANNGAESLQRMQDGNYDVVLMDVQMPVMDGLEATRRIRQNSKFSTLPIIALSAGVTLNEQEICTSAGMTDFIGKPIDFDQLTSKLTELCSLSV